MSKISPFAPKKLPKLPDIEGVKIATAEAGIKYKKRTDLLLMTFMEGTVAAGVLTQSKTASAPVRLCRRHLEKGGARALVVNSGNSNAFTGKAGEATVTATVDAAAEAAGCVPNEVYVASTGVIGQPFGAEVMTKHFGKLVKDAKPGDWESAAKAIMTTDTFAKVATRIAKIGKTKVTLNGIAKGAGMIAPDMATMLSFVATDAPITAAALQAMVRSGADQSFNCVTIDGDTSTSDTLLVFATGAAAKHGAKRIDDPRAASAQEFREALDDLLLDLAIQVAKDGEGLTKFVTLRVTGAESDAAARRIGLSIANSPLVKTALAGNDPNWGRIVMAVGKSGEAADRDRLSIRFGDVAVATNGMVDPGYREADGAALFKEAEIEIGVDLGIGRGRAVLYTCDLTADYVSINADYRS